MPRERELREPAFLALRRRRVFAVFLPDGQSAAEAAHHGFDFGLPATDCVPVADWHDRQDRKSDWKRHFPAPFNDASDHQSVLTTHQRSSPLPVYQ